MNIFLTMVSHSENKEVLEAQHYLWWDLWHREPLTLVLFNEADILVNMTTVFSLFLVAWSLSCVWLFSDCMDDNPAGSSVHGILQARILEWAAISFSRGSSQPRNQTHICYIGRQILDHWATRETPTLSYHPLKTLNNQPGSGKASKVWEVVTP